MYRNMRKAIPILVAVALIGILFLSFVSATAIEKEIVVKNVTFASNTTKLIPISNLSNVTANITNLTPISNLTINYTIIMSPIPLTPVPTIIPTPTVTPTIKPTPTVTPTPTPEPIKPLKIKITQTKDQIIPSKAVRIGGELIAIPETTVRLNTTTIEQANKYIAIFEPEYSTELPIKKPNLKVTTETSVSGRDMTLTIRIENTGDAEARNIKLSVNRPPELKKTSLSGAYATLDESIIKWDGERLEPGDVHVIDYKMQFTEDPDEDLEFPISLSWGDIYGNEWLMSFILKLLLTILQVIPGFEVIFAIAGVLTVYLIRQRRRL